MHNPKRLFIASLAGLASGLVCLGLAASGGPAPLPWPVGADILTSRTLIGVAIGISALTLGHWSVHGMVMGFLFSLPLAFNGLMAPENPEFSKTGMFVWTVILGVIYGLAIEFVTSVIFKARQQS